MKKDIQSINFSAHSPLKDYLNIKLDRLPNYYDKIIGVQAIMKKVNSSDNKDKLFELIIEVPGGDIFVKKQGQSFEECIDLAMDTGKRMLKRKKEKMLS